MIIILNDFAVIGGDRRLFYLAKFLHNKNFKVIGLNLANFTNEKINFVIANSLEQAITTSKYVVGPIPFSRNNFSINCDNNFSNLSIANFLNYLSEKNFVFAGNLSKFVLNDVKNRAKFVYDYFKNENFAVFNAMLTAEAAVAEIVLKNSNCLNSFNCLILGFGRCGKLLAIKLKNFCNNVVVCSKNELELTWATALGLKIVTFKNLNEILGQFDLIVNTIPFNLLKGEILKKLKKDVYIYDITSKGISLNEIYNFAINVNVSLQIPGKFKYKASAKYLANLLIKILEQNK